MSERHIADAESEYTVYNVTPDLCRIGKCVVPFEISQTLKPEKDDYAKTVSSHSQPVLMVKSIIRGVKGNAGKGATVSQVSRDNGHTLILTGSSTVTVEGRAVARHDDQVLMNVQC